MVPRVASDLRELGANPGEAKVTMHAGLDSVPWKDVDLMVEAITERLDVPMIEEPAPLDALLAKWPEGRRILFADESGDDDSRAWGGDAGRAPPARAALEQFRSKPVAWAILIGPEGGFTPQERAHLRSLDCITPISLGPRILRAETAALAALTLWQSVLGDWT